MLSWYIVSQYARSHAYTILGEMLRTKPCVSSSVTYYWAILHRLSFCSGTDRQNTPVLCRRRWWQPKHYSSPRHSCDVFILQLRLGLLPSELHACILFAFTRLESISKLSFLLCKCEFGVPNEEPDDYFCFCLNLRKVVLVTVTFKNKFMIAVHLCREWVTFSPLFFTWWTTSQKHFGALQLWWNAWLLTSIAIKMGCTLSFWRSPRYILNKITL